MTGTLRIKAWWSSERPVGRRRAQLALLALALTSSALTACTNDDPQTAPATDNGSGATGDAADARDATTGVDSGLVDVPDEGGADQGTTGGADSDSGTTGGDADGGTTTGTADADADAQKPETTATCTIVDPVHPEGNPQLGPYEKGDLCSEPATGGCSVEVCTAAAKKLGDPIPPCFTPACTAAGKCTLVRASFCCIQPSDCPATSTVCYQTQCDSDGLTAGTCRYDLVAGCCKDQQDVAPLSQAFDLKVDVPSGWSETYNVENTNVRWRVLGILAPDTHCRTGGSCIHLGYHDETKHCYGYYNGAFLAGGTGCVPDATAAAKPATRVSAKLRSPQLNLSPKDAPWVLTFQLRMSSEAAGKDPQSGVEIPGDPLVLDVIDGEVRTRAFDSRSIGNTTHGDYRLVTVNLGPWAGKSILLEWGFDTQDGTTNFEDTKNGVFEGVFIDDVDVRSTCDDKLDPCAPAKPNCVDTDGCTANVCAEFEPIGGVPTAVAQGICLFPVEPGCEKCTSATDCVNPPGAPTDFSTTCAQGKCQYLPLACVPTPIVESGFETGLPSAFLTVDDLACDNAWGVTTQRSANGGSSLYFGNAAKKCGAAAAACSGGKDALLCPSYGGCVNAATSGEVELGTLVIPPNQTILASWSLFLSTEFDGKPAAYIDAVLAGCKTTIPTDGACTDRLLLIASYNSAAGPVEDVLWTSYDKGTRGSTQCQWKPINVNLSGLAGKTVKLRFVFHSVDQFANGTEGVYIDDLKIGTFCGPVPCTTASDCPAVDACHPTSCIQGECQSSAIAGCCVSAIDCDDDNSCTTDTCEPNQACKHTPSAVSTCCSSHAIYWEETFDGATAPAGWTFTKSASDATAIWQHVPTAGAGGSGALYFGNLKTGTYADGNNAVSGSVTMPPITVPAGGDPLLLVNMKVSTEFDKLDAAGFANYLNTSGIAVFDRLAVYADNWIDPVTKKPTSLMLWRSEGGTPLNGTTRTPNGEIAFLDVGFSLKPIAGQAGAVLRFEFNSFTGDENAFAGITLDNVRVSQVCPSAAIPSPCYTDAWCEDGDKCTADTCTNDKCVANDNFGVSGCCFAKPQLKWDFEGGLDSWTATTPPGAVVVWQSSKAQATSGKASLRFVNPVDDNYSGCLQSLCGGANACDGLSCPESACVLPQGTIRSPDITVNYGKDYNFKFGLRADLNLEEGALGSLEQFRVRVMGYDGKGAPIELATLVCHDATCSTADPCASGVNFRYPGCASYEPTGDYGKWLPFSFKLSETLCKGGTPLAESFVNYLADQKSTGKVFFQVDFSSVDNYKNCGAGLFVDDVQVQERCEPWLAVCGN